VEPVIGRRFAPTRWLIRATPQTHCGSSQAAQNNKRKFMQDLESIRLLIRICSRFGLLAKACAAAGKIAVTKTSHAVSQLVDVSHRLNSIVREGHLPLQENLSAARRHVAE
jgi:hypothetical protein